MDRRAFHKTITSAAAVFAIAPRAFNFGKLDKMSRIAMSTVTFRERFESTKLKGKNAATNDLTLLQIPGYFADRFRLHNMEFWSKHFESIEPAYLKELKNAIKKQKSTLVNIQFDEDYQIGSPDEQVRKKSLELALRWVDAAKTLCSGAIRVNPGKGEAGYAIDSLKIIKKACQKNGLILMVENHFGMEMDTGIHLRILKEVGKNIYSLPDYGNYPNETRYEALAKIIPYAYQISAKTIEFDEHMNHLSFDFDRCMKMVVDSGFKGIYSVEQWSPTPLKTSEEAIADWMIERVKTYC
ncbi:MAG: hypothetical protein GC192_14865 [Bacteroidetes bacterium]|nr:hypothetical protein [Bacteroidota bacterium]